MGQRACDPRNRLPAHDHRRRHGRAFFRAIGRVCRARTRDTAQPPNEDEYTFVYRGRIGGLVGEDEIEVEEGGLFFKPRGIVHALWNPTEHPVIVIEFISPAGFEHFFEEMGALTRAEPEAMQEIAQRYGQQPYPDLISGLETRHSVRL